MEEEDVREIPELKATPDRTDILAFIIAYWQVLLPMILVFFFLMVATVVLALLWT